MASTRISTPMRGVTAQMARLAIRRETTAVAAPFARTLTTSSSALASLASSITTSVHDAPPGLIPMEDRSVHATIHQFPSLEPLRLEAYPANHLYLPTRKDILHRAVIFEGDATRLGTASTKWRSEVRGSRKKIRPQKGSGKARLGDKMSPMLRGGGVAFGPHPRDFSTGLQKKVYDLAWRTALSYRFRKGELVIVDNALEIESPSSALVKSIFKRHHWGHDAGCSILVTTQDRPLLRMAMAATPKVGWTKTWDQVDVKDMLSLGRIVIERAALQNILMTHQTDIFKTQFSPKPIRRLEPVDLQRILGWTEFQRMETAAPDELATLQPVLYNQLADKRFGVVELMPKSTPADFEAASRMQLSAYELKLEAMQSQIDRLEAHEDLAHENSEYPELQIKAQQKRIEVLNLEAERCAYFAESVEVEAGLLEPESQAQSEKMEVASRWKDNASEYAVEAREKQSALEYRLAARDE